MLTPEKIQQANSITGMTVPVSGGANGNPISRAAEIRSMGQTASPTKTPAAAQTTQTDPQPTIGEQTGQNVGEQYRQSAQKIQDSVSQGAAKFAAEPTDGSIGTELKRTGDLLETGLGAAAGAAQGVFAPLTGAIQTAMQKTGVKLGASDNSPAKKAIDALNEFSKAHPEAAKNLMDSLTVATSEIGGEGALGDLAKTPVSGEGAVNAVKDTIKTAASAVGDKLKVPAVPLKNTVADAAKNAAAIKHSIDSVSPELSGKKLANAYQDVVKGNREVSPSGVAKSQEIGDSKRTTDMGTRLSDLGMKSTDPIGNLKKLGAGLSDTEKKLNTLLESDKTPVDKGALNTTLDSLNKTMPREFSGIRDSKSTFESVVNFAKETVGKAPNSIKGMREARTAFDNQARLEYPSAFKEGAIDMKTPAGRAIRSVRDAMNDYLYSTAENGSELQSHIEREADIFNAAEAVASKAAKGEGKTKLSQIIDQYPTLKKAIPFVVGAAGGEVVMHHL